VVHGPEQKEVSGVRKPPTPFRPPSPLGSPLQSLGTPDAVEPLLGERRRLQSPAEPEGRGLIGLAHLRSLTTFACCPPATMAPTPSVACRSGSSKRCAYRAVVCGWVCPRSAPIIGSENPDDASRLA